MSRSPSQSAHLGAHPSFEDRLELSRLLAAATVNLKFARLLLEDPETALQQGYQNEVFLLSEEERTLILSLHADSLSSLAQILLRTLEQTGPTLLPYPAQTEQYCTR